MADNLLTGLLQKQNKKTGGWKDIASAYFSGNNTSSKKTRNLLIGQALFGGFEMSMQNKALKNLQENDRQKTFELAGLTQKWEKYDKLMTENEAYKADPYHFRLKAETEFSRKNKDFKLDTEAARTTRTNEISEYEKALINLHEEKIKTGNFNKRMTKESFFKPFEDYYDGQAKEITSSKNLSIVHKGWDKLTNRGERKAPVISKEQATRSVYDFLLEPTSFTSNEQIELYRDPNEFVYNKDEAKSFVSQNLQASDPARVDILNTLEDKNYTTQELKTHIVTNQVNFNPIIAKNKIAINAFNTQWKEENNKKELPVKNTPEYMGFFLRRENYVDQLNGTGNPETIKLRSNMFELQDIKKSISDSKFAKNPEKHPMYTVQKKLENDISLAGINKVEYEMYKLVSNRLSDPAESQAIYLQIASENTPKEGRTYEYRDVNDYVSKQVNQLLSGFNYVFNISED